MQRRVCFGEKHTFSQMNGQANGADVGRSVTLLCAQLIRVLLPSTEVLFSNLL